MLKRFLCVFILLAMLMLVLACDSKKPSRDDDDDEVETTECVGSSSDSTNNSVTDSTNGLTSDSTNNSVTDSSNSTEGTPDLENMHTVTFITNCDAVISPVYVEHCTKVTAPQEPEREHYNFDGWYLGDEKWSFIGDVVTEDITLEARWVACEYTVSFDGNGATSGATQSLTVKYGEKAILPQNGFERKDYIFKGWSTTSGGEVEYLVGAELTMDKAGITLYAVWKCDTFVIMSKELEGLFNPFYYYNEADKQIVSMTQIDMLFSKYVNGEVQVAYGDNEPVVTKDYMSNYDPVAKTTTYTFVLKNGIKYSDGHPLTMEDVLFNLYVYLDPVYAGSATLYSTKILGLTEYRTQQSASDSGSSADDKVTENATNRASSRIEELINLYRQVGATPTVGKYYATIAQMTDAINALEDGAISSGYKTAVSANPGEVSHAEWKAQLLADYQKICQLYLEEVTKSYDSAIEAFTESPYKEFAEFKDALFCFMAQQGYVEIKYAKGADGRTDYNKIESLTPMYNTDAIKTKEAAIEYAYTDAIESQLDLVLLVTGSAQTLTNEFISNAKDVILHENVGGSEGMQYDHISGIVSLGHKSETKGTTITVNGNTYTIASAHNADGTVTNASEYDVLQITIDGVDPKAVWNFAFAVAPQHYYGEGSKVGVDIENNKFGVEWGSFDFMTKVIQSTRNITVPMGAGAYKATDRSNNNNPAGSAFYNANVVYFKRNDHFTTVGSGINNAKIEKVRYQVVGASNALAMLENGSIHYATPQLTENNFKKIEELQTKGAGYILTEQLGYGYVGINASKVTNLYLRRAIMCAMDTSMALNYYRPGTAQRIFWSMSTVSWAYPKDGDKLDNNNGKDYPMTGNFDVETAKANIQKYMNLAMENGGYSESDLKITFTIAGSNLQDHPTYETFRDAAALLNSMGWNITVQADTQALTKLATGSLAVWAAAWGSTIDPDMYQVYHKNSTATSTLAWGYPSIKNSGSAEEKELLNSLSDLIEMARSTDNKTIRADYYKQAMSKVLDLAIELPVYQRSVVYVINENVINKNTLPKETNPYSSPLDRIWEIEFVQ